MHAYGPQSPRVFNYASAIESTPIEQSRAIVDIGFPRAAVHCNEFYRPTSLCNDGWPKTNNCRNNIGLRRAGLLSPAHQCLQHLRTDVGSRRALCLRARTFIRSFVWSLSTASVHIALLCGMSALPQTLAHLCTEAHMSASALPAVHRPCAVVNVRACPWEPNWFSSRLLSTSHR